MFFERSKRGFAHFVKALIASVFASCHVEVSVYLVFHCLSQCLFSNPFCCFSFSLAVFFEDQMTNVNGTTHLVCRCRFVHLIIIIICTYMYHTGPHRIKKLLSLHETRARIDYILMTQITSSWPFIFLFSHIYSLSSGVLQI